MAKPENGSFRSELLSVGLYKRNQGRLARQLTAAGLGLLVIAGAYVLSQGPLSALDDQYYRVTISCPKEGGEKEAALDNLAAKHSLTRAESVLKGDHREVQYRVSTSWLWTPNAAMTEQARKDIDEFVAAARNELSLKPLREPDLGHKRPVGVMLGVPLVLCVVFGWVIFRLVNYPKFAEFLISVEAEMNKVSWASKQELYRATIVVLSTMVLLGVVLLAYDTLWYHILQAVGVLRFSQ